MLPLPSSWNWCPDRIFRLVAFWSKTGIPWQRPMQRVGIIPPACEMGGRETRSWPVPSGHHRNSLQVQKGRIVEKIADLLNAKKLALLGDIRDESAEDIRLILEPRNRSIEPQVLMEQMFRMTDLETRAV